MAKSVEDILKETARDAGTRSEGIVAAILTLAIVGTEKQNGSKYVIEQYKKMIQELRQTGDTWN
jgi:hypothetical protein